MALEVRHQVAEVIYDSVGDSRISQERHARESDPVFDVLRDMVFECEGVVEKSLTESGEYLSGEVSGVMDVVAAALRKHFGLPVKVESGA
jgi:hypothetical protein